MKWLLDTWHKVDHFVLKIERALIVIGLAIILAAGSLNILLRLSGFTEFAFTGVLLKQLTLWLGLLGAAIATSSSEHLNVDAFSRLLKDRGLQVNKVFIGLLCVGFSGLFLYYSIAFFQFQSKQMAAQFVGGGKLAWIWVVVFPFAFFTMLLRYTFQTLEHGHVLFNPEAATQPTQEGADVSIEPESGEESNL